MTIQEIETHAAEGGRFTLEDWSSGIAWRYLGQEEVADEDTEWTGQRVATGRVRMMMVGDDREFREDPDYVQALGELDYCACCGAVGCQWDGRDRDE